MILPCHPPPLGSNKSHRTRKVRKYPQTLNPEGTVTNIQVRRLDVTLFYPEGQPRPRKKTFYNFSKDNCR